MLTNRILAASCLAAAAAGLWAMPSGWQKSVAQVAAPAPAPAAVPYVESEGQIFLYRGEHEGGGDDEGRKLHAQDHAHEQTTRELLAQYRNAQSPGDRSGILEKLSTAVREQFDVRQQIRAKELEELEARVRKLRELHEKREDAKSEIVERRVEQLVHEADGLGWSGSGEVHGWEARSAGAAIFAPRPPAVPPAVRIEAVPPAAR
jgi:hypothetical protein